MGTDAKRAIFIVALIATLLLACSQNMGPVRVQRDATNPLADDNKMVRDAQANLELVNSLNNSDVVDARVHARAHDPRNASTAVTNNADARRLRAEAKLKIADAQYGVDKAKADAQYNAAKARCEGHSGVALNSCRDEATASYVSKIASARSRKDAALLIGTSNG